MYQIDGWRQLLSLRPRLAWSGANRTVLLLGLTSFLTDISSEMVVSVLPLYLVIGLNLSPLAFGVVDGLYAGATAVFRIVSGYVADRFARPKEIAFTGYAMSVLSRLGLLAAGGSTALIGAAILLDRFGKGIRTAPRDAMISLASRTEDLGRSFGLHRAMDTAGAMLGPLLAFAILMAAPGAYDAVFVASLCVGVMGLAVIGLFVRSPTAEALADGADRLRPAAVRRLVATPRLFSLLVAAAALAIASVGDGFLYLALQDRVSLNVGLFPLLFVATALAYMVLAVPAGRLADRFGRLPVFLAGYGFLLLIYGVLLLPPLGGVEIVICLTFLGAYYAATDGVLMAAASTLIPPGLRTTGLAFVTTVTSLGRMASSVLFGAVWTWQGLDVAIAVFGALLALAMALSAVLFIRGGMLARPAVAS